MTKIIPDYLHGFARTALATVKQWDNLPEGQKMPLDAPTTWGMTVEEVRAFVLDQFGYPSAPLEMQLTAIRALIKDRTAYVKSLTPYCHDKFRQQQKLAALIHTEMRLEACLGILGPDTPARDGTAPLNSERAVA